MANLIARVKNSQSEVYAGKLFQSTFFVDDTNDKGIKHASFITVKSGTSKAVHGAEDVGTLHYVQTGEQVCGFVYEETRESQYDGPAQRLAKAESTGAQRLFPAGAIEDMALGLMRHGVMEISKVGILDKNLGCVVGGDTKYRHFKTGGAIKGITVDLSKGMTVAAPIDITAQPGSINLKDKDIVNVAGNPLTVVVTPASGTGTTAVKRKVELKTAKAIAAGGSSANSVGSPSDIGKPIYVNLKQDQDGELPFTLDKASKMMIGWVESPIAVRINVDLALLSK